MQLFLVQYSADDGTNQRHLIGVAESPIHVERIIQQQFDYLKENGLTELDECPMITRENTEELSEKGEIIVTVDESFDFHITLIESNQYIEKDI